MQTPPSPLTHPERRRERRRSVLRLFEQEGWGSLELLEDWDGADLEELRGMLRPEEYEKLLDHLRDQEDGRR